MTRIVFTVEENNGKNNAGPKAKRDIDYFLKNNDFEVIHKKYNVQNKISKLFDYCFSIPRIFNKNEVYDEIFFQYPTYSSFLMRKLVRELRQHCHRLFFIIHDVEALRLFSGNTQYWDGERGLFNQTDGLIVHNGYMKKWLSDNGVKVPMINLGIFDYQSEFEPRLENVQYNASVCFAGNLKKSEFLNSLTLTHSSMDLFGPNANDSYGTGLTYRGQYSPEVLPKYLNADFGLVWDGNSTETCNGLYGNYMRFNDPHKVSLYLSTGLPVIIWKEAALADFIEKNDLGFTVKTLSEMDEKLANLTHERYLEYKKNAINISTKIRNGEFIKSAVSKLEFISNNSGE